jgi:hypothetical protein
MSEFLITLSDIFEIAWTASALLGLTGLGMTSIIALCIVITSEPRREGATFSKFAQEAIRKVTFYCFGLILFPFFIVLIGIYWIDRNRDENGNDNNEEE